GVYPPTAAKRHRRERALHPDSHPSLLRSAAAGAICMSACAGSVPADCLVALISGNDRGAGPICRPKRPGDRGGFETSEISGGWRAGPDTPGQRLGRHGLLREVHMKNHGNIDVWLERVCQLMVVGLSISAAFLLRFDFSIPPSVGPILRQAV